MDFVFSKLEACIPKQFNQEKEKKNSEKRVKKRCNSFYGY